MKLLASRLLQYSFLSSAEALAGHVSAGIWSEVQSSLGWVTTVVMGAELKDWIGIHPAGLIEAAATTARFQS